MFKILRDIRNLQILSAMLAAIGVADSAYLSYTKLTHSAIMCGIGECDVVNASPYSSIVGIPVAFLGLLGYSALFLLAAWALAAPASAPYWLPDLRLFTAFVGWLFAAYLTALELFVIHAICIWCVLQAAAITAIVLGLILERQRAAERSGA